MLKKCPGCNDPRPIFGLCKSRKDGLSFYCKRCRAENQEQWVADNQGRYKAMRVRNKANHG